MSPPRFPIAGRPAAWFLALASCTGDPHSDPSDGRTVTSSGVEIRSATADATTISQANLSVEISEPATVAAACVRRDDPTEVHLLEADGATEVTLRFSGLLAATDYDCNIAPILPPGAAAHVAFRTPDPPLELASAEVQRDPALTMTGAYTVMTVRPECFGIEKDYIAVLDPDGNNRWRYDLPPGVNIGVEVAPDGPNRFLWGGGDDTSGAPGEIDVLDGRLWKLGFDGSEDIVFHHDVNRIDDGRVLSVEETDDDGWAAFQLRLSDEAGETSWLWNAETGVASGWLPPPSDSRDSDPHHLNWADVVETNQGLVAYGSLCFAFLTVAIDVETGQPLWKFGYDGDFTLVDAQGNALPDQDDFPQCQHGLQMDGTHLLVYDNGFSRGYTRAVEYTLDTDAMTATKTWEWLDEGFWETYHGGTDWLTPDHERVLIAEGNNDCGDVSERHSQVVEIDRPTNTVVHRLILRDIGHWIYRAHRVDGCGVFANAKYCPALATRLDELRGALDL